MRGLLSSELLRLRSRRLVWVLALLAVAGILVGVTIGAIKSHRPSARELASARAAYRNDLQLCLNGQFIPKEQLPPGETMQTFCADAVGPENYVPSASLRLSELPNFLKGSSFVLIVLGLVVGASSAGADWQTGSFTTLLTWEPRRARVLLARTIVVGAVLFLLAVALQAMLSLSIAAAASLRGTTVGTGAAWLRGVVGTIARVGIMSTVFALLGLAVATIGRNTAAALGASFVYLAVVEGLLRGLIPRLATALLSTNVAIFVDGRPGTSGGTGPLISVEHAFVTIALYGGVLTAVAVALFRARDVT